jgi:diguanylate cyclase (GGDEF)-like protein/PAS domain S-box-containing protein
MEAGDSARPAGSGRGHLLAKVVAALADSPEIGDCRPLVRVGGQREWRVLRHPNSGEGSRAPLAPLLLLLVLCTEAFADTPELAGARVLLLHSYHPTFQTAAAQRAGVESVLVPRGVVVHIEYMDSKRHFDPRSLALFEAGLRHRLSRAPPYDVILAADDNALEFAAARQETLFHGAPVVFLAVNRLDRAIELDSHPRITGVVEAVSIAETVALARTLDPKVTEVVAVVDGTPSGRGDRAALDKVAGRLEGVTLRVLSLNEHSWDEVLARLRALRRHQVVLRMAAFHDRDGRVEVPMKSMPLLGAASAVPMYDLRAYGVGAGSVGGVVLDFAVQGREAAHLAVRILQGEPVAEIPVIRASPNVTKVDARLMERFGLDPKRIPADAVIVNREPARYVGIAIGLTVVVIVLLIVVAYLVLQARARRRMEHRLRESEERFRVMVEGSILGVLIHRHRKLLFANQAYADMLGYRDPSEVLALGSVERIYAPHERERLRGYQKARLEGRPAPSEYDYEVVRKDGSRAVLHNVVHATTWNGQFATQHNVVDVSERLRAEVALKEKSAQLEATFENTDQGIATIDANLNIVAFNQRYLELMGLPPERCRLGTPFEDIVRFNATRGEYGPCDVEAYVAARMARAAQGLAERFERVRPDGTVLEIRIRPLPGGGFVTSHTDVTETHRLSKELTYQASHDSLTNLLNRREFEDQLRRILHESREDASQHAMCYLDLDQFKVINDTCGHIAGDELLRQLGESLKTKVRRRDILARLGGDEFGVLLEGCALDEAHRVAASLRTTVEEFRFMWEGRSFRVGVSIGLVPVNGSSGTVTDVLSAADSACYAAKDQGRNRIHVYHEEDVELASRQGEMQWVVRVQHALEDDRMQLDFQPIVPLSDDAEEGDHFELLLRMEDETGALVPPGVFLPAAERYNLMGRIDRWVVRHALESLAAAPEYLERLFACSINLSGQSVSDDEFRAFVVGEFERTGVPANRITFEITETAAISNFAQASGFMAALKEIGCRFALDDFGSGLSSFGYLKTLPVDYLKIDGIFVKDILDDPIDLAMVKCINEIGHVMGKRTIAEFVENDAIRTRLKAIGVDYAQGYGVGRPARFLPLGQLRRAS